MEGHTGYVGCYKEKKEALLDLPVLLNSHTQANSLGVAFSILISVGTKTAILNLKIIQAL